MFVERKIWRVLSWHDLVYIFKSLTLLKIDIWGQLWEQRDQLEAAAIFQARVDRGLVHGASSRDGKKWSDSEYISKVEAAGFSDILDVGWEKKRRVNDDWKCLGLRSLKTGVAIGWERQDYGRGRCVAAGRGNADKEQRQINRKASEA